MRISDWSSDVCSSDLDWCQLYFEDVRVPAENVLLREGGFKKQIAAFNVERLGNSARALAFGRHAFGIAREHAATRVQFGRTLSEFQGIQWKFAEMAARMEAAQLMLYRVAQRASDRLPEAFDTALVQYLCNEARSEERRVGKECVRTFRSRWSQ